MKSFILVLHTDTLFKSNESCWWILTIYTFWKNCSVNFSLNMIVFDPIVPCYVQPHLLESALPQPCLSYVWRLANKTHWRSTCQLHPLVGTQYFPNNLSKAGLVETLVLRHPVVLHGFGSFTSLLAVTVDTWVYPLFYYQWEVHGEYVKRWQNVTFIFECWIREQLTVG